MKRMFSVIAGCLLLLWATGLQAATISFDPLNSTESIGSIFTVDIIGQNFPVTPDTVSGGLNLFFDPAIVNVLSVTNNEVDWDLGSTGPGTIDNIGGSLTELWVASFTGVAGPSFTVTTIEFEAVGLGTSGLTMTAYPSSPWVDLDVNEIFPVYDTGSLTVAVIPEPASILLIGSGLAGIIGLARKKKQ